MQLCFNWFGKWSLPVFYEGIFGHSRFSGVRIRCSKTFFSQNLQSLVLCVYPYLNIQRLHEGNLHWEVLFRVMPEIPIVWEDIHLQNKFSKSFLGEDDLLALYFKANRGHDSSIRVITGEGNLHLSHSCDDLIRRHWNF